MKPYNSLQLTVGKCCMELLIWSTASWQEALWESSCWPTTRKWETCLDICLAALPYQKQTHRSLQQCEENVSVVVCSLITLRYDSMFVKINWLLRRQLLKEIQHSITALNLNVDSQHLCSPAPCNFSFSTFCRFSEMKQKCWKKYRNLLCKMYVVCWVRAKWQAVRVYQCNPGQTWQHRWSMGWWLDQMIPVVFSNHNDSVILWFHHMKLYLSRLHPQRLDSSR